MFCANIVKSLFCLIFLSLTHQSMGHVEDVLAKARDNSSLVGIHSEDGVHLAGEKRRGGERRTRLYWKVRRRQRFRSRRRYRWNWRSRSRYRRGWKSRARARRRKRKRQNNAGKWPKNKDKINEKKGKDDNSTGIAGPSLALSLFWLSKLLPSHVTGPRWKTTGSSDRETSTADTWTVGSSEDVRCQKVTFKIRDVRCQMSESQRTDVRCQKVLVHMSDVRKS